MRKDFSLVVICILLLWVGATLLPNGNHGSFDLNGFGRLPVLADGRLKPMDTVARTGLLMVQGRQRVDAPGGVTVEPVAWLLDVLSRPVLAVSYPHYLYLRDQVKPDRHVYFNIDDYSQYWPRDADAVNLLERQAVREADLTVCVSHLRAEEMRQAVPEAAPLVRPTPFLPRAASVVSYK